MTDPLLIPPPSVHQRKLTNDEIVDLLGKASEAVHADMSFWRRMQESLLWEARDRMLLLMGSLESARKANEDMRRQRNEARAGQVSADWWNDIDDPENSRSSPGEALDDASYGQIVGLTGAAQVEEIWGFRLEPADDADSDDEREVWCSSLAEAKRKLAEMTAAQSPPAATP